MLSVKIGYFPLKYYAVKKFSCSYTCIFKNVITNNLFDLIVLLQSLQTMAI